MRKPGWLKKRKATSARSATSPAPAITPSHPDWRGSGALELDWSRPAGGGWWRGECRRCHLPLQLSEMVQMGCRHVLAFFVTACNYMI
eukprot:g51409.t1